jgi:manganese transport protein
MQVDLHTHGNAPLSSRNSQDGRLESLPEVNRSVPVDLRKRGLARFLTFAGPGFLVSVGYMDPGNWATCIAGGSKFGYTLLSVVLISNVMAMVLQALAARLGIATGRDLAQSCREQYSPRVGFALWVACELAIIACDLAEVIGSALALKLLFGIPIMAGAVITVFDTLLVLLLMQRGFRWLEAFILTLIVTISGCFAVQLAIASPDVPSLLNGFMHPGDIFGNPEMLYIAIGILGATVMPHNLYLHSSIVQTRAFEQNAEGRRDAVRWATLDSTIALGLALFVNASILILAAATFYTRGRTDVVEIEQAYQLLSPVLGVSFAATLFGVALLASGLNSTVTGTLAGQIVMEGFLRLRLKPWLRRLITRGLAVVPVLLVTAIAGEGSTGKLLVLSQVILSMQLPFAVIPLIQFVSNKKIMGDLVIPKKLAAFSWGIAAVIVVLNAKLLIDVVRG